MCQMRACTFFPDPVAGREFSVVLFALIPKSGTQACICRQVCGAFFTLAADVAPLLTGKTYRRKMVGLA